MKVSQMTPLINVQNAARSIEFYRDVLSFEVANQMEFGGAVRWARIQCGPIGLMINQSEATDSSERLAREQWYADAIFFFDVDDARTAQRELAERGLDVDEPKHEEYGWEFHLRDPDGYALGFTDTK